MFQRNLKKTSSIAILVGTVFFVMNVLGALPWTVGVTLLGYALGKSIHNVDRYLLPIIGVIVVVSFVPVGLELLRARRRAAAAPR